MNYEYGVLENFSNFAKHGLKFEQVIEFEWETALIKQDQRRNYLETRFQATGYIFDRLYVLVFCERSDIIRVISLRKANYREIKDYAKTETQYAVSNSERRRTD